VPTETRGGNLDSVTIWNFCFTLAAVGALIVIVSIRPYHHPPIPLLLLRIMGLILLIGGLVIGFLTGGYNRRSPNAPIQQTPQRIAIVLWVPQEELLVGSAVSH